MLSADTTSSVGWKWEAKWGRNCLGKADDLEMRLFARWGAGLQLGSQGEANPDRRTRAATGPQDTSTGVWVPPIYTLAHLSCFSLRPFATANFIPLHYKPACLRFLCLSFPRPLPMPPYPCLWASSPCSGRSWKRYRDRCVSLLCVDMADADMCSRVPRSQS